MNPWESVFFWAAVFLYLLASLAYIATYSFGRPRWAGLGRWFSLAGLAFHTAAGLTRWGATGHPPVMGTYENALAGGWFMVVFFFVMLRVKPDLENVMAVLVPSVMLLLGYGVINHPTLEALEPPYKSPWLIAHVVFAWFAYASFTIAAGIGVTYLLKERAERKGIAGPFFERLPPLGVLDDLNAAVVTFGFFNQSVMLIAGSIWAKDLWGAYWQWDPIETWSLICWLVYATYLHLRMTWGWQGRRLAWLSVVGLLSVLISFWGIGLLLRGYHLFLR